MYYVCGCSNNKKKEEEKSELGYYIRIKTFHRYDLAAECQLQLYRVGLPNVIEQDQNGFYLITNRISNLDDAVQTERLLKYMRFPAILLS